MSSFSPITTNSTNTCPHGLPPGACPICNGMGGGSSSKPVQKTNKYSNPKQTMSLSEMYAIWNRMKTADARKEQMKADILRHAEMINKTKNVLVKMMNQLNTVLHKIENILPKPIVKIFQAITKNILKPIQNIIQKFPEIIKNFNEFINDIKTQLFVAAEKLASVFGEIKNFIKKSISNNFKKFTKKVYKILNIFGLELSDENDEYEEAVAEIAVFKAKDIKNLKEMLFRLIAKENKGNDDDNKFNN